MACIIYAKPPRKQIGTLGENFHAATVTCPNCGKQAKVNTFNITTRCATGETRMHEGFATFYCEPCRAFIETTIEGTAIYL